MKVPSKLTSLAQVIADEKRDRIDLLKIDAEGAEFAIVAGLRDDDWQKVRQAVVEVHQGADDCRRMNELLVARGFHVDVLQQSPLFPRHFLLYARRPV